jgi:hypothetical protein
MNPDDQWLEKEINEVNREICKRQPKTSCNHQKEWFLLALLVPFIIYTIACQASDCLNLKEINSAVYNNSQRIYFKAGVKNIELIERTISDNTSQYHKNILIKILCKYSLKIHSASCANAQLMVKLKEDIYPKLCLSDMVEDKIELIIKIIDTAIYCFETDDLRNEQPIWSDKTKFWYDY